MTKESDILEIRRLMKTRPDQDHLIIADAPELSDNASTLEECDAEGLGAVVSRLENL